MTPQEKKKKKEAPSPSLNGGWLLSSYSIKNSMYAYHTPCEVRPGRCATIWKG